MVYNNSKVICKLGLCSHHFAITHEVTTSAV